eukprot:5588095-Amphidinium_carterae.1
MEKAGLLTQQMQHKQGTLLGAICETVLGYVNNFLETYIKHHTKLLVKGSGKGPKMNIPEDAAAFAALFQIGMAPPVADPHQGLGDPQNPTLDEAAEIEARRKVDARLKKKADKPRAAEEKAAKKNIGESEAVKAKGSTATATAPIVASGGMKAGTPGSKSAAWGNSARSAMAAAKDVSTLFATWSGFTLGACAAAIPELGLIILLLDKARPCVSLLTLSTFPIRKDGGKVSPI